MTVTAWTDEFDDSSLDATRWGTSTVGSGSVSESGGVVTIDAPATADGAVLYWKPDVADADTVQVYEAQVSVTGVSNIVWMLGVFDTLDHLTGANTAVNPDYRIAVLYAAGSGIRIQYVDATATAQYWNGSTWTSSLSHVYPGGAEDTVYVLRLNVRPGQWSVEILNSDKTAVIAATSWVDFIDLNSYTSLHVTHGEPYSSHYDGTVTLSSASYYSAATAIQSTRHQHTAGTVALTQTHQAAVAGTVHRHTAADVAVTQSHAAAVQFTRHGLTSGSPALTQQHAVAVTGTRHAVRSADVAATQQHAAAVAAARHRHTAEAAEVAQQHVAAVQSTVHRQTAAAVELTQSHAPAVQSTRHAVRSSGPSVTESITVAVQSSRHRHTAGSPAATQQHVAAVAGSRSRHRAVALALVQQHVVVPSSCLHRHRAGSPAVSPGTGGLVLLAGTLRIAPALAAAVLVEPEHQAALAIGPSLRAVLEVVP